MDSDSERQVLGFLAGVALGAVMGAGVALLTAPQSGRRSRRRLRRSVRRARGGAEQKIDALSAELRERVDDIVGAARERVG